MSKVKAPARLSRLMVLVGVGCAARVDVSTERSSGGESAAVEKLHTNVAVEVLSDQKEASGLPSPPEQPPTSPETDRKAVEVAGIANFAMIVHGDLHLHEHFHEYLHLENPPRSVPKRSEEMPQPVKVEVQRPRIDPRCERLLGEHLERVREWKAMMGR